MSHSENFENICESGDGKYFFYIRAAVGNCNMTAFLGKRLLCSQEYTKTCRGNVVEFLEIKNNELNRIKHCFKLCFKIGAGKCIQPSGKCDIRCIVSNGFCDFHVVSSYSFSSTI